MQVVLEPHELKYIHKVLDEYGNNIIIIIKDINVDENTNLEAIQEKEIEVKKSA